MLYNGTYLNIMMIQGSKGYAFHACMKCEAIRVSDATYAVTDKGSEAV